MSRNPKQPSQPSQPSRAQLKSSDLTVHDSYLVALHLANLVVTAETVNVRANIRNRLQRFLEQAIAEYDAALRERDDLQARFDQ